MTSATGSKMRLEPMTDEQFWIIWNQIKDEYSEDILHLYDLTKNSYNPDDDSEEQKKIQRFMLDKKIQIARRMIGFFGVSQNSSVQFSNDLISDLFRKLNKFNII
ncbi:hypothetical protein [Acetobacter sp. DsW_063]|uniref:hypothetical protein n=1 Tax=Acetobacter sp. DsW_063 TaxID=1514894 RepID=UPI000A3CA522|nr:hypothetical protein [Acetobacter sp. DsW_063]OUJ15105.1 hypothetical protein HK28_10300 [Acetobacter sp. DsW_063]